MRIDPEIAELVREYYTLALPEVDTLSAAEARALYAARTRPKVELPVETTDHVIPGPSGSLRIRCYRPKGKGPFGACIYFHGGGWVLGNVETHDATGQRLCYGSRSVVVSVEYRLAPEHPYPAAPQDCFAATVWAATHAEELEIDPERIAVAGDSAGGNLAAVVALMARDHGGPPLCFQLLIYPSVDVDFARPSYIENAEGYMLTQAAMRWFWDQYAPQQAERKRAYCAPIHAESLEGLPAALVLTAELDPLRDEGRAYAERLRDAGVPTRYICYSGAVHGLFGMAADSELARRSVADACEALRAAFA